VWLQGTAILCFAPLSFILPPGKVGAYLKPFVENLGGSLQTPAQMMFLSAVLQPSDLTRAQSALFVLVSLPKAIGAVTFTAVFYGSRERVAAGFITSTVLQLALLSTVGYLPRQIPPRAPLRNGGEATKCLLGRRSPNKTSAYTLGEVPTRDDH
jgi:hypothetical protein